MLARLLAAYRATGADSLLSDPARAHGVPLEGYFWRIVHPPSGVVVVALGAVCRNAGGSWGLATLAAHPGGFSRTVLTQTATASEDAFGLRAEAALRGDAQAITVDLGPDARLDVTLHDPVPWPRRGGALGAAHAIPGLPHYWHPVLLSARVDGRVRAAGVAQDLDGAVAYAEKNWGSGFPGRWWWGHAASFDDPGVSVSFAGGHVPLLGGTVAPTAVVLRLGGRVIALAPPLARTRVALGADSWRLRTRAPGMSVEISGEGAGARPHELLVPVPGAGSAELRSRQHLAARLELTGAARTAAAVRRPVEPGRAGAGRPAQRRSARRATTLSGSLATSGSKRPISVHSAFSRIAEARSTGRDPRLAAELRSPVAERDHPVGEAARGRCRSAPRCELARTAQLRVVARERPDPAAQSRTPGGARPRPAP